MLIIYLPYVYGKRLILNLNTYIHTAFIRSVFRIVLMQENTQNHVRIIVGFNFNFWIKLVNIFHIILYYYDYIQQN